MVLRGTKTRPDHADLLDYQHHIHRLKILIESLEEQESDVEHEIETIIHQPTVEEKQSHSISIDELKEDPNQLVAPKDVSESIRILIDRLEWLEHKHKETEQQLHVKQDEYIIMIKQFMCGGMAGMTARTTVAPIDRIKLIIQTALTRDTPKAAELGIIGTARHEIRKGGVKSLWKGNLTNCMRVFPYAALQFSTYERYKSFIVDYCHKNDRHFGTLERLMSGALAGATASTLTYPLDVMRLRQAVYDDIKGPMDAIRNIYGEGGVRFFFKGWTPTLLSLGPFIGVNFATFDSLKTWYIGDRDPKSASTLAILGLGASAGIIAQTVCYPLDTIRRSMQMPKHSYNGIFDCAYKICTNPNGKGILSMYKGLLPNAIKIVPNNGIRFLVYNKLTVYLGLPQKKGGRKGD
mmetsp:Transcript_14476/g.22619  ORF Transcript_14476/g.22619 Transcript_14476/m.22619 type:complete len:407 (-) Transcript_14476:223-1443(-)|eukprot:CAMPEP_0197052002 /NCGR_PEP_ID=MMETSP1384-20130603/26541_1 /TAXON_ID=29189 /ORGANISM="Ammonia sp." /LENGTH=406 /DNA_ID=CAMNT_0042484643 /DNA_START=230 /DNA_END=1450 /DNA_ORIENTATION=-